MIDIEGATSKGTAFVRASGVAKSFSGEDGPRHAVAGVSLDVARGEIVSIIGRSGAGKSTLLRLLGGLLEPDAGSVTIDNIPASEARAKKYFGLMPQAPALFPWRDVQSNVALLAEVNRVNDAETLDVNVALATVGLQDRAASLPSELSGGMQQRVAMARALVTRAPVLLLDEPFASLDEVTRAELHSEVLRIWADGQHTVILVTHSIAEAVLLSDRVAVMAGQPGRIVDEVAISEPRPRLEAMDSGTLRETIARIRGALATGASA